MATLYIQGCEALWLKGTPKESCGSAFAKLVRDKRYPDDPKAQWHSGYYWQVVKEAGFTRNTPSKEPKTSSPVPLKLELEDPRTWDKSPNHKQRLPFIQFLKEDVQVTLEMINELQKNYEDKEVPVLDGQGKKVFKDGKVVTKTEPDLETPREWHKLFSTVDTSGAVTPDPQEVVDEFFKVLRNIRAKMQSVMQKCMDGRQLLMPWMIFPLKCRGDIISKAHFGKQYYVHFKRRFTITTKKITQFEESIATVADYLRFVMADSWQWGYSEFLPCPNCVVKENPPKHDYVNEEDEERELAETEVYMLEMFPFDDGRWKWHCANCDTYYNPVMMTEILAKVAGDANGMATLYLQRAGVKIPREGDVD